MGDVKEEGDLPDCRWTCPNGVNWDEEPVIRSVRSLETNVDKIEEFHRCSVMSIAYLRPEFVKNNNTTIPLG